MMTALVDELSQRARALSPEDRARLADELLASLDEDSSPDTEQAWEQEIGRRVEEMAAIKTHNPFAINDLLFARATGVDWRTMNNHGCSLVWGHPQAPMGTRTIIELIEELALRGGGFGLFTGCAAGDTAMAVVLEVTGA